VKLGEAQSMAGNLSAAHDAYSSAIDQNPRYMPALFGIADVERAMGRRNAAIDRYREILRISPSGDRGEQARNALRGLGADVE
jgi:predicted TPR repeat methyltransferase